MKLSRLFLAALLASSSGSLMACTNAGDGDDTSSDEADIKKKVSPKGGNGEFDLLAPTTFAFVGFAGAFQFDNASILSGAAVQKVPGTYVLRGVAVGTTDGQAPPQSLSYAITAGAVTKAQLGGLNVHFDKPLTLGSVHVDLTIDGQGAGFLEGNRTWQTNAAGSSLLLLAGKVGITSSADATRSDVTIDENKLTQVVLPTATVKIGIDAYDPAYPTPTACAAPLVRAGTIYNTYYNYQGTANVRNIDGTSSGDHVVPAGKNAPVTLSAYGIDTVQQTTAGATLQYTLNRLEIDDVEIAQAGGGSTFVKGTVTIVKKGAGGAAATALNCSFPTHSGVDLPDGDYTVTSRATTASGTVTSSEDVSFP